MPRSAFRVGHSVTSTKGGYSGAGIRVKKAADWARLRLDHRCCGFRSPECSEAAKGDRYGGNLQAGALRRIVRFDIGGMRAACARSRLSDRGTSDVHPKAGRLKYGGSSLRAG
jgi:hypothetical protein